LPYKKLKFVILLTIQVDVVEMSELKISIRQILRSTYDEIQTLLETVHTSIVLEGEPYCTIQGKAALRNFKLILDHPQFVFDDIFIARQLYFSALPSRNLVINHPKFRSILAAKPRFMDYFYERYGPNAGRTQVGMCQRYIQAENAIRYWKKMQNRRLLFHLYPALIHYSRKFKESYYAPGAAGYMKALKNFTELSHTKTCFITSA
jgi:hypothetical protein